MGTYQSNLKGIVQKLLDGGVERVLVVTPTPVYEAAPQAIPEGEVSDCGAAPCWLEQIHRTTYKLAKHMRIACASVVSRLL